METSMDTRKFSRALTARLAILIGSGLVIMGCSPDAGTQAQSPSDAGNRSGGASEGGAVGGGGGRATGGAGAGDAGQGGAGGAAHEAESQDRTGRQYRTWSRHGTPLP